MEESIMSESGLTSTELLLGVILVLVVCVLTDIAITLFVNYANLGMTTIASMCVSLAEGTTISPHQINRIALIAEIVIDFIVGFGSVVYLFSQR